MLLYDWGLAEINPEIVGVDSPVFDRSRFLIAQSGVNPKKWAEKYDLVPFKAPCGECNELLETTIPFASGQLRGLMAPTCSCGNELTPYCVVRDPRYGDLL